MQPEGKERNANSVWVPSKSELTFGVERGANMQPGMWYEDTIVVRSLGRNEIYFGTLNPDGGDVYKLETLMPAERAMPQPVVTIVVRLCVLKAAELDVEMFLVASILPLIGRQKNEFMRVRLKAKVPAWRMLQENVVLERELENGRFARVWKGTAGGMDVAVKEVAGSAAMEKAFRESEEMFSKVEGENIVRFVGTFDTGKSLCLVTEFVPHGDLAFVLGNTVLSEELRVRMMLDVARGLKTLHEMDIVHGNLMPSNVLVVCLQYDAPVVCKIGDFGPVWRAEDKSKLMDLLLYGAPEQYKANTASKEGDIFSLGILMCEIWGQKPVYEGEVLSNCDSFWSCLSKQNKRPAISEDCPVVETILSCLRGERMQRPSIGCVVDALFDTFMCIAPFIGEKILVHDIEEFHNHDDGFISNDETALPVTFCEIPFDPFSGNIQLEGLPNISEIVCRCACTKCLQVDQKARKMECGHVVCSSCRTQKHVCDVCHMVCRRTAEGFSPLPKRWLKERTCVKRNCLEPAAYYTEGRLFLCQEHNDEMNSLIPGKISIKLVKNDGKLDERVIANYLPLKERETCALHARAIDSVCQTCHSVKLCWKCCASHRGHVIGPYLRSDVLSARRALRNEERFLLSDFDVTYEILAILLDQADELPEDTAPLAEKVRV